MPINVTCSKCSRLVFAPAERAGNSVACPGCGESIPVPADASPTAEQAVALACPGCNAKLRVTRQLHGKKVHCTKCATALAVSADPWSLSVVSGSSSAASRPPKPARLPVGMPPVPDGGNVSGSDEDPLAFLRNSASGSPLPTPGHINGVDREFDILARYRRRSRPWGERIKEIFTLGLHGIKKRSLALKLQHEVNSLRTARDGQLEILGTLILTHRPPTVNVQSDMVELSHIQNELAQRETTIESLHQTKGGGATVKELKLEAAQLRNRQQAMMVAIGKKAWTARPEMPGAAGAYAALDRVQSSLAAKQGELKVVADAIGPFWDVEGRGLAR